MCIYWLLDLNLTPVETASEISDPINLTILDIS